MQASPQQSAATLVAQLEEAETNRGRWKSLFITMGAGSCMQSGVASFLNEAITQGMDMCRGHHALCHIASHHVCIASRATNPAALAGGTCPPRARDDDLAS
jgi:hypothetical protein